MRKMFLYAAGGVCTGALFIAALGSKTVVTAAGARQQLKSCGRIEITQNGESLRIDSDDFYTLADEIDAERYALEQLESIVGTLVKRPDNAADAKAGQFYVDGEVLVRCVQDAESKTYVTVGSAQDAYALLEEEISQLKKSVSDGKISVAAAVTDKGGNAAISADGQETFPELSGKIRELSELWFDLGQEENWYGNAERELVKTGRTFTNKSGRQSGSMADNGDIQVQLVSSGNGASAAADFKSEYTIRTGYTSGGEVEVADLASQTKVVGQVTAATPIQIAEGCGGYVAGEKVEGAMKLQEDSYVYPAAWTPSDGFTHTSEPGFYKSYSVNAYSVWKAGYENSYQSAYDAGYQQGYAAAGNGG